MIIRKRDDFQIEPRNMVERPLPEVWTSREKEVMDTRDFAAMIRRRIWIIAAVAAVVSILGGYYTFTRPKIFEATAKIMTVTPKSGGNVVGDGSLISDLEALKGTRNAETQVEIIGSPDTVRVAGNLLNPEIKKAGVGGDELPPWSYRVMKRKDADVIAITGRAYTPVAAAEIADAIITAHFQKDLERTRQATRQAREYAETEMLGARRELAAARVDLAKFKKTTGLFAPETQLNARAERLGTMNDELASARAEVEAGRRQIGTLKREMSRQSQTVVANSTVTENPQYTAVMNRIDALQSERAQLLQEFTPESREVQTINDRINREEAKLKSIARTVVSARQNARNPIRENITNRYVEAVTSYSAATARVNALEQQVRSGKKAATNLPDYERQLNEQQQKVGLLQRRYETLADNYHTLLLSEQAVLPSAMTFANAVVPTRPTYPNKAANTIFFLIIGIALGIPLAILVERADTRLHDQDVIEQSSGLPSLSVIPKAPKDSVHIIDDSNTDGAMIESYRILRNNINFATAGGQLRVLAVTSPGRGEGKSTTTLNLATAMAMDGKRVLMVDADLRRPSLHRALGINREVGLTTVIAGDAQLETAVVETKTPGVFCLPSGPTCSTPGETLNSEPSRELFRRLSDMYDLVLVDCPPCTGLADVQTISTLADAVVLVVSMHQSLRPQLEISLQMLSRAGAPLLGTVVNRVNIRSRDYCYYYSQSEYELRDRDQ